MGVSMRDPEAIISRYWLRVLAVAGLVAVAVFFWTRNPYPAAEVEHVAARQEAFDAALAANWQAHPSEDLLGFVRKDVAEELLSHLTVDERNRISQSSCGWVTRKCLDHNRKTGLLTCMAYPEETQVGDIVCRASFPADRRTFPPSGKMLGFVLSGKRCFLTTWSHDGEDWRVRSATSGSVVDLNATAENRIAEKGMSDPTALRLSFMPILAATPKGCP